MSAVVRRARFRQCEKLAAHALGERVRPHVAEGLVGGAERLAGVGAPVLAPKPLPVRASDQMFAGQGMSNERRVTSCSHARFLRNAIA